MLFFQLKLSAAYLPMNCVANTFLLPLNGYAAERTQLRSSTIVPLVKSASPFFTLFSSCMGSDCSRFLHASIGRRDISSNVESHLSEAAVHLSKELSSMVDTKVEDSSNLANSSDSKDGKEMERRRKIGLANKGKVPWNKGRKHSAETRERIRQKTREALSNPQIRKKMSECPRSLSNHTKDKISKSIRKLWVKRLKRKRTRQKLLQLWAESIAIAAKEGGIDEQELEWDSYKKMEREMAIEQEQAAQRAKEKEMAHVQAKRIAKERTEMKKRLEESGKLAGEPKRKMRKMSKEEKEELAVSQELKLKARLMKIHKRKSSISQVSNQHQRAWDNMELTKREELLPQVTLADQIRLAKIKRAE